MKISSDSFFKITFNLDAIDKKYFGFYVVNLFYS